MRIFLIFPVFLILFLLVGCWDKVEVNDMALIVSAGIDKIEDDRIELTVQVFIPNPTGSGSGSSGGGGGGEGNVYTFSTQGSSMADALTEIQKKLPRYFTWGHTKAYVFGEALARQGMYNEFDFLFRDIQPREQANFFVCKGTAKKLLESQNDPNTYETLIKLSQKPSTRSSTMHEVEEMFNGDSGAFLLPVASLTSMISNGSEKAILSVSGISVIHMKKLAGFLNSQSLIGIRLLNHAELGRNITLTKKGEGGQIVIRVLHTKAKLFPTIENGIWKVKIQLKLTADVVQNSTTMTIANGTNSLRKLEGVFDEELKKVLKSTLDQLQKELKTDVVGFARAFHKKYPQEWKKVKNNWGSVFQTIDVQLEVNSEIHRPGITNITVRGKREGM
ncbi:Ger(x)C family spore germination protein [Paenibacillus sp. UNC451MF]|uniref:Ger(x)C family spore germination protein n=1 Tax=Paenibacillus sp. UNC451MF TaxID=1449063 RepID=UPI00048F6F5A|nr:Ger(x)C family spore germination protein [Paenibacillus sp. UNC451MF]